MTKEELRKYRKNEGKNPLNIEFGRRLKEILDKRDMPSKAAIIDLGWSKSTFYTYSSGRRRMRVDRFAQLIERLSLTMSEIAYLCEPYWRDYNG